MLERVEGEAGQASTDNAYDSASCYEAILARGAVPTIPPRRNARLGSARRPPASRAERDAVVRRIEDEGRYSWRASSGATRQSLVENAMSRFKARVGERLAPRALGRRQVEAPVKRQVLNRMLALGMPRSERISVG
jgi:hypothetical protein